MPLLTIQIVEGHNAQQKQALLQNTSQAVVDSIGAPISSVRGILTESPSDNVIVAGQLGRKMARVDVHLIVGRTPEQKEALIAALNAAVCKSLDITGEDVRVILRDIPKTDMGMANGKTALAAGR